ALLLGAFAPGFPAETVSIASGNGFATEIEEPHGDGAWVSSIASRIVPPGTYDASWTLAGGVNDFDFGTDLIAFKVATGEPAISISGTSVIEPSGGSTSATFNVSLSEPSTSAVTVEYSTANETATAGSDYTATSGTLTFAPGVTSRTIQVPVL